MRLTHICTAAIAALAGLAAAGCGQDEIEGPEPGSSGEVSECGGFYPGEVSPDGDSDEDDLADAGVSYGSALGETLPCFVWTSVRSGEHVEGADPATYANAYLSMPEIYLKSENPDMSPLLEAQFGVTEANAILFAVVAFNCSGCPAFLEKTLASKAALAAAGIIPIGVASFSTSEDEANPDAMDLVAADDILEGEGLDATFYRSNDPEHYVGTYSDFDATGFPTLVLVRVRDMKVVLRDAPINYYDGEGDGLLVDALVDAVEGFSE